MTATEAFEQFTGHALRALNAQDGSPSPFGPNIIGGPSQRLGDLFNSMIALINRSPVVTVTASDATGGSTDSDFAASARDINGSLLKAAVQFVVVAQADQYDPELAPDASATFGTATTGSIVDSGAGWALVETDANGEFACTLANSADETLYVNAAAPVGGAEDTTISAINVVSNSDDVTWSA